MLYNGWKSASKLVTAVCQNIKFVFFIYLFYSLCSPGTYRFLLLYVALLILFFYCQYRKRKRQERVTRGFTPIEDVEHEFATTCRARYYNRIYIVALVLVSVLSTVGVIKIVSSQVDDHITTQYLDSIDYILEASGSQISSFFRKSVPLVPNVTKQEVIYSANFLKLTLGLSTTLSEDELNEELVAGLLSDVESLSAEVSTFGDAMDYVLFGLVCIWFLWLSSMYELRHLLAHRSVQLTK